MLNDQNKAELDRIMDVFAGSNGGIDFAIFRSRLIDLQHQVDDGDTAAQEVMEVMHRFYRLVQALTPPAKE